VDLVKTILKALIKSLQHGEDVGERYLKYARLEASEFYGERKLVQNVKAVRDDSICCKYAKTPSVRAKV